MKQRMNIVPAYLRPKDAAIYTGISVAKLETLRNEKRGPKFVKRDGVVLYKITDLDEYLSDDALHQNHAA
jgi:hypothetical protein